MHRPVKPPLCKGRWHGVSRDGGIGARMGVLDCARKATIPQSALRLTAPFTQGGLFLYDRKLAPTRGGPMQASAPTEWVVEKNLAPEGSNGEGSKSVKKNAALLHFLAFGPFDHLFGVPRGRAPWAGVRCLGTARLFSLPFLVTKKEGLSEASH